jgi:hypothetical protein
MVRHDEVHVYLRPTLFIRRVYVEARVYAEARVYSCMHICGGPDESLMVYNEHVCM